MALKDLSRAGLRKWLILSYLAVRRRFVHAHYRGIHKFQDVQRAESRSQELTEVKQPRKPSIQPLQRPKRPRRVRSARTSGLLNPRRSPNALRAPLLNRPHLPERPHDHPLLQRNSGRPATPGIVRAGALLTGDAARGRPGGPGGSAPRGGAKPAVTWAAFPVSALPGPRVAPEPDVAAPGWAVPGEATRRSPPPSPAPGKLRPSVRSPELIE